MDHWRDPGQIFKLRPNDLSVVSSRFEISLSLAIWKKRVGRNQPAHTIIKIFPFGLGIYSFAGAPSVSEMSAKLRVRFVSRHLQNEDGTKYQHGGGDRDSFHCCVPPLRSSRLAQISYTETLPTYPPLVHRFPTGIPLKFEQQLRPTSLIIAGSRFTQV
jgi:hypothetical protein